MIFNPVMPNVTELISPRDIKFFPNPSVYDYIVDRNSDVAGDGTGNHGSLRYCMTNCASGAIIVFADVLSDSASTGDIKTVKITSSLPNKTCTVYGNDHYITIPPRSNFVLRTGMTYTLNNYSLHIRDIIQNNQSLFSSTNINFFGCKFERCGNNLSKPLFTSNCNVNYYNCNFDKLYGGYYIIDQNSSYNSTFNKCNISNINAAGGVMGSINCNIIDCYLGFLPTALHNNSNCIIKNSYKTGGDLVYHGDASFINSIVVNGRLWAFTNFNLNKTITISHCTFINDAIMTNLGPLTIPTGYTLNLYAKNNLIITPANNYVLDQTIPSGTRNITESGNIYMAINNDPLLPNSTRFTGNVEAIIDFIEYKQYVEYVQHNYFNPKGSALLACSRLSDALTDYNGVSRTNPCDCGAVQT